MPSLDVLVVGGGPCGLTAALAAARRGRRVHLVESTHRLGGLAASLEVAGQRVDLGSHRLHPSAPPAVQALLAELLGDELQVRARNGRLHLAGSWVGFPLRPLDAARSVPLGVGARIAADLVSGPWRRPRDDSYAEVIRAGLGPTALATFHGPMAAKLWGRDPATLSGDLARRRVAVNDGRRLLVRLARGTRASGRTFRYPRLGYGQIVERLAEAVAAAGVTIELGTTVDPARLDDARRAGHVLWTAPPAGLAAALGGPVEAAVDHRGLVLVYLAIAEDRYSAVDAHYVPDPDVAFARLSEPKNYRDGPDPAGRTVLCAEVPATPGDARWSAGDRELADVVLDGMDRIGLRRPPAAALADVAVVRVPRVYPVLPVGGDGRDRTLAWADGLDGVAVLGRQGRLVADNLHHVMDMALAGARCLTDRGWDGARWAAERRRFADFVVDD